MKRHRKPRPSRADGLGHSLAALRRITTSLHEAVTRLSAEYARGDTLTAVDIEEHARLVSITAGALTAQLAKRGFALDAYCSDCTTVGYSTTDAIPAGWSEVVSRAECGGVNTRLLCPRCRARRDRSLKRHARAAATRPGLRLVSGSSSPAGETTKAGNVGS